MKVMLRFDGGVELARALGELPRRVSLPIQKAALIEAAEPMRVRMSELAPHEPGAPDLRESMRISPVPVRGDDRRETAVKVGPSRDAFYGLFQEFGTAHHGAQPFARPAFDAVAPESLRILGAALWRELAGRGIGRTVTAATQVFSGDGGDLL